MAIRFDKKFNAEIRREIDKVNKKFARARKLGYTGIPENLKIRDIKEQFSGRYATRRELRRQIGYYKKADIKNAGKVVELETGQRISLYKLKEAQRKNIRLLRKVGRDIKKEKIYLERAGGQDLPFNEHRTRLESLESTQAMLREGVRASESNLRQVNELYAREYSSLKRESFEDAFYDTLDQHIEFSNLSQDQKNELKRKIRSMGVDALIDANRYNDYMADVLDRYKNKDDYNDTDKRVIDDNIEKLYEHIDEIIAEYTV